MSIKPEKKLLVSLGKVGGRTNSGRITVRHRGGGVKRLYRIIDFGEAKLGLKGKIVSLEYDPYRTALIALVVYEDGEKKYIIAAKDLKVGDEVVCQDNAEIRAGNRIRLKNIPVGTKVFNLELEPGKGGKLIRGAGTSAIVLAQEPGFSNIELPSKEVRKIPAECFATIGQVSHAEHRFENWGKAGRRRLKGWRPSVRGTAMNPPDHPHGHGGGRTSRGMKHPKTPWGKPAFGVRTRPRKWTDKYIITRRKP
ncbi:MAG: 50S ribosomal protein L2 [Candidatus Nealsonbacteria bacterium]|nr:50S ribosomal protein L2 [Candidatus Nealsonbacteria bacterium]